MILVRWLLLGALLVANGTNAQYPARGQPDPAFNSGRPRVVGLMPAGGQDSAFSIAPLSATRFAVGVLRSAQAKGKVLIVDTTPENVAVFDTKFGAPGAHEDLYAIATSGSGVVLGGGIDTGDGKQSAVLQWRDVGLAATARYDDGGTVVSAPTDAAYPLVYSAVVAATAPVAGIARVWQVRSAFTADASCARATLHALDHGAAGFTERYMLDLTGAMVRACITPQALVQQSTSPAGARALVVASGCSDQANGLQYACLVRIVDDGVSLHLDPAFGTSGLALYGFGTGLDVVLDGMTLDAAGNVLVAASRYTSTSIVPVLVRFRSDGQLDGTFGATGTLVIPTGGTGPATGGVPAVAASGTVLIPGAGAGTSGVRPFVAWYDPATGSAQATRIEFTATEPDFYFAGFVAAMPLPGGAALAVGAADTSADTGSPLVARLAGDRQTVDLLEYFHAGFGHYFVTANVDEMKKLDDGTFVGWERTGEGFTALPTGAAGAADVCRFFSTSFAPKSSHFYTPLASECDGLKGGNVWAYEGLVFALQLASPTGACPAGTRALFRLYNDGQGGAPNHRYTVAEPVRAAQVVQGWIGEGAGSPPVFACVPG